MRELARLFGRHLALVSRPEGRYVVDLGDPYWVRLLIPTFRYEREIAAVLDRVWQPGLAFLDCGANIGFWSVYAHNRGAKVVAVEAGDYAGELLERNSALNGGFVVERAALWDVDGVVIFDSSVAHHVGGRVAASGRPVRAITLDTLMREHNLRAPLIVKLDVEGAEGRSLAAARDVLQEFPLVIYEDHGDDPTHNTTRTFRDTYGMHTYWLRGKIHEIEADDLTHLKIRRDIGYNLAAVAPESRFISYLAQ